MRYTSVRSMDISNGEGIGIALFVQGCHFHCKDCFNSETWDFNGGHKYNTKTYLNILELANNDYITRLSILGGEPLANENVHDVLNTVRAFKREYPNKKVWLYTGFKLNEILKPKVPNSMTQVSPILDRKEVLKWVDYLVDGRFETDKKDLKLKFKGSSNQNIWKKENGEWVLYG